LKYFPLKQLLKAALGFRKLGVQETWGSGNLGFRKLGVEENGVQENMSVGLVSAESSSKCAPQQSGVDRVGRVQRDLIQQDLVQRDLAGLGLKLSD
jgi:hypothetical protein